MFSSQICSILVYSPNFCDTVALEKFLSIPIKLEMGQMNQQCITANNSQSINVVQQEPFCRDKTAQNQSGQNLIINGENYFNNNRGNKNVAIAAKIRLLLTYKIVMKLLRRDILVDWRITPPRLVTIFLMNLEQMNEPIDRWILLKMRMKQN